MHGGCVDVLSKLDFFVGRYLGLTGATVRGADAFHAGLCTVYMPRERLSLLHDRLNFLREHRPDVVAAAIQEAAFDPGLQTKFRDDRVLEVLAVYVTC
jgi:enoyl-CoA hydratase/carnithine racemase